MLSFLMVLPQMSSYSLLVTIHCAGTVQTPYILSEFFPLGGVYTGMNLHPENVLYIKQNTLEYQVCVFRRAMKLPTASRGVS